MYKMDKQSFPRHGRASEGSGSAYSTSNLHPSLICCFPIPSLNVRYDHRRMDHGCPKHYSSLSDGAPEASFGGSETATEVTFGGSQEVGREQKKSKFTTTDI